MIALDLRAIPNALAPPGLADDIGPCVLAVQSAIRNLDLKAPASELLIVQICDAQIGQFTIRIQKVSGPRHLRGFIRARWPAVHEIDCRDCRAAI